MTSKKVVSWEANFKKGSELGALLGGRFRTLPWEALVRELAKEVEMLEPTFNRESVTQRPGKLRVLADRAPSPPKSQTGLVASAAVDSGAPEGGTATSAERSRHRLLLSIAEAAGSLGISRAHFYEFLNSKAVPTVRLGRRRMVRVDDLAAFVASLETVLPD
jgi:excisionase family DNA binding protein